MHVFVDYEDYKNPVRLQVTITAATQIDAVCTMMCNLNVATSSNSSCFSHAILNAESYRGKGIVRMQCS